MEKTKSGKQRVAAVIRSAWMLGLVACAGCLFNQQPKYSDVPDLSPPVAGSTGDATATANSDAAPVTPTASPAASTDAKGGSASDTPEQNVGIRVGEYVDIVYTDAPGATPAHEKVRDDGTITLMFDKTFKVLGKTSGELAREIRATYVPEYFKQLTVSVTRPEIGRYIYVDGEVRAPSKQMYTGPITLSQVIAACGGFTDFANKRNIELFRANGKKEKFDYKRIQHNPKLDPEVNPNDRIVVHRSIIG